MTDQEVADFLSNENKKPVSLAEAQEINRDLTAFADLMLDAYSDFKKRGLIQIDPKSKKVSLRNPEAWKERFSEL